MKKCPTSLTGKGSSFLMKRSSTLMDLTAAINYWHDIGLPPQIYSKRVAGSGSVE
ncbi:TPA: hypothetical protein N0F65_002195 [Lagenidium giganteum]|uniref:Uncharacterized protein n=1 Tax=Lagenidium giganteum TaxID=4803 RepID=A0AAV2YMK8_9STRA|nr:TPA: hypothetical protein N0F65_002195 [Lagenidium giganteum]